VRDPANTTSAFYPNSVIDAMLERVANGEAMTRICATPGYPTRGAWYRWVTTDPVLAERYGEAVKQSIVRRRNLTTTA
jgi:hypothetical protein